MTCSKRLWGGSIAMFMLPDLSTQMSAFLKIGLVVNPWLAGVSVPGRLDAENFEFLDSESRSFAAFAWTDEVRIAVYQDVPSPDRIARTAVYEITSSTAVSLAHQTFGQTIVTLDFARKALELMEQFVKEYGFAILIQLYTLVTSYENQHALEYYGDIPERQFVTGEWHRPWVNYSLSDELLFGTIVGNYEVVMKEDKRYVRITDTGREMLRSTEKILKNSGYLSLRIRQIHISRFNLYFDYDKLANEIWPDFIALRREFLKWVDVVPRSTVLELGCADGVFTFDGGLANRVGPKGQLFAVDPAPGMIVRAETKRQRLGANWVSFIKAAAESLPFADRSFDTVIGIGFLHFTDIPVALKEIFRVTRVGGTVASLHPTYFNPWNVPFFYEWFKPVLQSARKRSEEVPRSYLEHADDVVESFRSAGFVDIKRIDYGFATRFFDPDSVIENFIFGVGWFQEELATLPWKARQDLIAELKERGYRVCKKYSLEERLLQFPNQMLQAKRP